MRRKQARRKSPNAALMKEHCDLAIAVESNFLNPTGVNCGGERDVRDPTMPCMGAPRMTRGINILFLLLLPPPPHPRPPPSTLLLFQHHHLPFLPPYPTPSSPPPPSKVTRSLHVSSLSLSPCLPLSLSKPLAVPALRPVPGEDAEL
jgi:hypothetical protein